MFEIFLILKANQVLSLKGMNAGRVLNKFKLDELTRSLTLTQLKENTLYKVIINDKLGLDSLKIIKDGFLYKFNTQEISLDNYSKGLIILTKYGVFRYKADNGAVYLITKIDISPEDTVELIKLGFIKDIYTNDMFCNLK